MSEEIKVSNSKRWQGRYKNINFTIHKWKPDYYETKPEYDEGWIWNFYIFVKPRRLKTYSFKDYKDREQKRIDYNKMYPDVELHGGITYMSRHKESGMTETDELGCDYNHIWDMDEMGHNYERSLDELLKDVKNSIDTLPEDLFFKKP